MSGDQPIRHITDVDEYLQRVREVDETAVTPDVETLAENLRRCAESDPSPTWAGVARALLASEWLAADRARERAEGAREALLEVAETLGDHRTLPEADDESVFAVMAWLRDRANRIGGAK